MDFPYLGTYITSERHICKEGREQAMKGAQISCYLKDVTWKNEYLSLERKNL